MSTPEPEGEDPGIRTELPPSARWWLVVWTTLMAAIAVAAAIITVGHCA